MRKLIIILFILEISIQLNGQNKNDDFNDFARKIPNIGGPIVDSIPVTENSNKSKNISVQKDLNKLLKEAMATPDSREFSFKTSDLASDNPATFKGINNKELYDSTYNDNKPLLIIFIAMVLLIVIPLMINKIRNRNSAYKLSHADKPNNKNIPNKISTKTKDKLSVNEKITALKELQKLLDNGVINADEFEKMKSQLI